jgi:hypothetical protein
LWGNKIRVQGFYDCIGKYSIGHKPTKNDGRKQLGAVSFGKEDNSDNKLVS